ncbi:C45 family peptidase [Croceibacter atlanticus]|uniref:C45 family peptidase n=1 Tax=Croceibacter atlanticus TaxID=313588 RepID=UPI0030FBCE5E
MFNKKFTYKPIYILFLGLMWSCGINKSINHKPITAPYNSTIVERETVNDSTFRIEQNFLTKNKQGLWELYVEGDPLERGLITGSLTKELIIKQESVFFTKVNDLVPNKTWQGVLRKFLAWYNRKMYTYIPEEFKTEIYGVSRYSGHEYDYIASPYLRSLYLHGAHDIGHALQDLALVGCSSFAVWDEKSEDGDLLIGRNFDFYAGDEFAEEKIIAFVNPDNGYKYMSYTWGGMMGVVSGMNNQGLTVTINAGKSKIPLIAKTPISIVAREILQYAATIDEAVAIAKKREVFVSEAIFIGSAKDGKAALIEVSPSNFGVYEVPNSAQQLICSNHFQSEAYQQDQRNLDWIKNSHSQYRYDRMQELLSQEHKLSVTEAVSILRNKNGLNNQPLGYGNEKALNQLLAHHGIVFQPEQLKVWVSSNPYQLGEFVAYDLNEIFSKDNSKLNNTSLSTSTLNISKDEFLTTEAYKNYEAYRVLEREVEMLLKQEDDIPRVKFNTLISLNPDYWKPFYLQGLYYLKKGYKAAALIAFKDAKTKVITTLPDEERINLYIKKLKVN